MRKMALNFKGIETLGCFSSCFVVFSGVRRRRSATVRRFSSFFIVFQRFSLFFVVFSGVRRRRSSDRPRRSATEDLVSTTTTTTTAPAMVTVTRSGLWDTNSMLEEQTERA